MANRSLEKDDRGWSWLHWAVLAATLGVAAGLGWLVGQFPIAPRLVLRALAAGAGPVVVLGMLTAGQRPGRRWLTVLSWVLLWGLMSCGIWWLLGNGWGNG